MQQFGDFTASELYCPKCQRAQPVRERLLLVLPTGELHEFVCRRCGTSLGKRSVTGPAVAPASAFSQPAPRPGPSPRTRRVGGAAPRPPGSRKLLGPG